MQISLIVMNLSEIFILYLSCGAPFGVHYFLQNRKKSRTVTVLLKSFLTVVVWIPYALGLLNANIAKKSFISKFDVSDESDSVLRKKLGEIEKRLLQILLDSGADISVFEFREVVERYRGLTLARRTDEIGENEKEIFVITNHQNAMLGAKCLNRRNRLRLEFHQKLASRDFLQMLAKFSFFRAEKLSAASLEFATLLDDGETRSAIENLFAESSQIESGSAVKQGEIKVVWNANEHKPPLAPPQPEPPISVPFTSRSMTTTPAIAATASLFSED